MLSSERGCTGGGFSSYSVDSVWQTSCMRHKHLWSGSQSGPLVWALHPPLSSSYFHPAMPLFWLGSVSSLASKSCWQTSQPWPGWQCLSPLDRHHSVSHHAAACLVFKTADAELKKKNKQTSLKYGLNKTICTFKLLTNLISMKNIFPVNVLLPRLRPVPHFQAGCQALTFPSTHQSQLSEKLLTDK